MPILSLALKSILNRRFTAVLTVLAIAFSVTLFLGVERVRQGAKASFANTISGTDLIVGSRSGPIQLLLYSVFRIGNATNNISWESYREIAANPNIEWTIPIALGDSHKGFRVMGTNNDYFHHYRYGQSRKIQMNEGDIFEGVYSAVLGSEVARKLQYKLNDKVIIAHGIGSKSFMNHDAHPFRIVGILKKTGTPIDQTVHIPMEGIVAIHKGWTDGAPPMEGEKPLEPGTLKKDLQPESITAFMVGLESKIRTFKTQRAINQYKKEPLTAILPGVTLYQLWDMLGTAEIAMVVISAFVVLTGLTGMLIAILTTLNERRREMAILRSVGARPGHIFTLLVSEAGIFAFLGAVSGVLLLYAILFAGQGWVESQFGLFLPITMLTAYDCVMIVTIFIIACLMGAVPAWRAYKSSLADGMTIRI